MDAARWELVQEIFHDVVDLPKADRDARLTERCGSDATLRGEVEALIRGDAGSAPIVDRTLGGVAGELVGRASSLPQHIFGPYRATRFLGEGGMGVVYRGERADLDGVAAIKVLRDASLSPARRERFVAEQRTLAQLSHPGIARLFDAGTLPDGTPWIAMEYVEGLPLDTYCATRRPALRDRLGLLRDVCRAVQHAHQHLVVHRDLKPSNVLVTAAGEVKLLDFGIAKRLEEATDPGATRTGLRLMTPAYAAPEQVLGRALSVRTDVYALGMMAWELLTGRLPFDLAGASPAQVERLVVEHEPGRPSVAGAAAGVVVSRDQWADLDVFCQTALQKDPARRYATVDAMARDLERFLAGEPLEARGDSWRYRTAKFARRHARAVTVTAAVLIGGISLTSFYTIRLARARDAAVAEQVRAQRIQRFMTDLFRGRDPDAGPADSLRVIALLEQGVLEARSLDAEPGAQADLYETLGGIYQQLGAMGRADSLLAEARAVWNRDPVTNRRLLAHMDVLLGDLRTDQARYADADTLLRGALATLRALPPAPGAQTQVGDALVALGRSLTERGAHDTAMVVLDTATALLASVAPDTREHLRAMSELANATFYAGNYDRADSLNRQVLTLTKQLYGERHPLVAEDLMNLGATEQERGNYKESEQLFRQAIDITTAFHGENHYRTASNVLYLGRSLLLQNRYDEARVAMQRALAIRERVYPPTHPTIANTLNELGSLAMREERYVAARTTFERVLSIYRSAYPGMNFRVGVAIANLGDTYLYQKDFRRAEAHYREALTHYIASQGPDHLNTGIGYIKLGRALMRGGRFRDAEPEIRRGYAIVAKVAEPTVSFLQAARLDLSIVFDSTARPDSAAKYRAERERYIAK
ncbi:MAG: serine/threonine protein kinase [Gemmatimonadetes bacterium]|nr:serine/threonine protein kinase [Gemmatimonadota bacterium]